MTVSNVFSVAAERIAAIDVTEFAAASNERTAELERINAAKATTTARLNELPRLIEAAQKAGPDRAAAARRILGSDEPRELGVAELEAERVDKTNGLRGLHDLEQALEKQKDGERDAISQHLADAVEPLAHAMASEAEGIAERLAQAFANILALGLATGSTTALRTAKRIEGAVYALGEDRVIGIGTREVDGRIAEALAGGQDVMRLARRGIATEIPFPRAS